MSFSQLVTVAVTKTAALPTSDNFGIVLLAAAHAEVGPRVTTHTSLTAAEEAGFTAVAYPAIHAFLSVAFAQNPRPKVVKIGRRDLAPTQSLIVTPLAPQGEGYVWTITIDGTAVTYTEQAADTVALIIDGLVSAVTTAALGVTPTDNVTTLGLDADTAGEIHSFKLDLSVFDLEVDTADPGIATDLSAILAEDPDWLGLVLDSDSEAEVLAAATWAETRDKILGYDASESGVVDSGTSDDVASDLQTAQREYTFGIWTEGRVRYFYAGGLMAGHFARFAPGESTVAFKNIAAVETYGPISEARQLALEAKNVNHFGPIALNRHVVINGVAASGEFIDITRLIVYLRVRLRELGLAYLAAQGKVPYTAQGLAGLRGVLLGYLTGLTTGATPALSPDVPPTVTVPAISEISASDRANRKVTGIVCTARAAGAIHSADITLNLEL